MGNSIISWTCIKCNQPVAGPYAKCENCGYYPTRKSERPELKELPPEPQILSPATCWCSKCLSWVAPLDGKCPKCHNSDTLDPKFPQKPKPRDSDFSYDGQTNRSNEIMSDALAAMSASYRTASTLAPEHGYAVEQPTHDMIIAGVRAWNVWHSVIEVWRQMETVRRYQQQKDPFNKQNKT